ncbi:hypothetical protein IQ243_26800 [Nostocales cyanobacterium LEGE 11386]|nr:hypothetical protein [Nostocales cyanobacterium LEGE 11386]
MTHPSYTQQALSRFKFDRLKRIATEVGVTPTGDKTQRQTWINAIVAHQSAQLQKVNEQFVPEELTTVEISFYDHEIYCGNTLVAAITYDDDLTQPWVVIINNEEVHRASTPMLCHRYICTHLKDGSLPVQKQDATDTPCITGNEIMYQIATECEKYKWELLDNGIYCNDEKLGEVGYTNGQWWVKRASSEHQQKVFCNSVGDVVQVLAMVEVKPVSCEDLLDKPFDEMTSEEWERLREYEPVPESRELVTA